MANKKILCRDRNNNYRKVDVSQLKFRPSVYGILIEKNKILLSKQWDGYDFPGGGMNIDETIDQTLEREFKEETGIKVKRREVIACESSFFTIEFTKQSMNFILIYCLCHKTGGKLGDTKFDKYEKIYAGKPEWVEFSGINKIKFYNSVDSVKIIKKAAKL